MAEQTFDTSPEAIKELIGTPSATASANIAAQEAEAAREELEKFAAWIESDWFDIGGRPSAVVEAYLHDLHNGWKPKETT